MRRFIFIVILGILIGRALFGEDVHTVAKGETIYTIALSYGVSTEALMNTNGISDPKKLRAGQKLKIPQKIDAPKGFVSENKSSAERLEYVAVKNDTLFGIARKNGVTVSELREFNKLPDNYVLKTGDKLLLPSKTEEAKPPLSPEYTRDWPVAVKSMTKSYGKIAGGVVITSYAAATVRSLTTGVVQSAGPYLSYKQVIIVKTQSGSLYIYGGCERLSVKQGDKVGRGTELGRLSTEEAPQLLFMVSKDGVYIDPTKAQPE